MNAQFEFSGDRREVDVDLSDVEKKVLEREDTLEDVAVQPEATLLSAGQLSYHCVVWSSVTSLVSAWGCLLLTFSCDVQQRLL